MFNLLPASDPIQWTTCSDAGCIPNSKTIILVLLIGFLCGIFVMYALAWNPVCPIM